MSLGTPSRPVTRFIKRCLYALVLLGLASTTFAQSTSEPKEGGTLRVAVRHEIDVFDPNSTTLFVGRVYTQMLFNTLVELNVEGEVVPGLASSWTQPNDTTYQFQLQEGVLFHDGSPLTAGDVVYTFDRIRDPAQGSPRRTLFSAIESVVALDDHTVEFRLRTPFAPFLGYLANFGASIVSRAHIEAGNDPAVSPMGTGPFRLVRREGFFIDMERHDAYFKPGLPYLDAISFLVTLDRNAMATALRTGEVDFAIRAPEEIIDLLRIDPNLVVVGDPIGNFRFLAYNTQRAPFDDYRVRQAIAWAMDRQEIVDIAMAGHGTVLDAGPIPAPHWAALPEPCFTQDLGRAQALLDEAGLGSGFAFTITVLSVSPMHIRAAETLREQLRPLGIDVDIRLRESAVWQTEIREQGAFDATITGFSGMVDPDQFMDRFRTGSGTNYSRFSDPEFDDLLTAGRIELDPSVRTGIYHAAQLRLCEQVPMAIIYTPTSYDVHGTDVRGYEFMFSEDLSYLRYVWLDR